MKRSTTRIYQGASYTWQGWEEMAQWESDHALRMMMACLRSTAPNIPLRVRGTTNPDGAGHNWLKARYQASDFYALGDYVIGPRIDDGEGPPRRMIYSKLNENQLLLTVQPDYLSNIKAAAIDEGKYEAWTKGSWEILSGDLFGDLWPAAKPYATLPSFPAEVIPPTWRIDRCLDWGDSAPFSVLWFAESDGSPIVWNGRKFKFIRGDIVLIMEWFGQGRQPNTGLRLSTPQLRDGIIEREIEAGLRYQDPISGKWCSRVHSGAADTMIFNLKPGASDGPVGSIAEDFEEPTTINGVRFAGIQWLAADKSPGSRMQGWQAIRSRLNADGAGQERRAREGRPIRLRRRPLVLRLRDRATARLEEQQRGYPRQNERPHRGLHPLSAAAQHPTDRQLQAALDRLSAGLIPPFPCA